MSLYKGWGKIPFQICVNVPLLHKMPPSPKPVTTEIQSWEFAQRFSERIVRFCEKTSQWAIRLKKRAICSHRSFLVSDLSDSLISLIKKEGMSELLFFFKLTKQRKKSTKKYDFSQIFKSGSLVFVSLFWHEQLERFAHSPTFVLSDLSELLTVAHLIRGMWANERIPNPALYGKAKLCVACEKMYLHWLAAFFRTNFNDIFYALHAVALFVLA